MAPPFAVIIYLNTAKLQSPIEAAVGGLTFVAWSEVAGGLVGAWVNWRQTWKRELVAAWATLCGAFVWLAWLGVDAPRGEWVAAYLLLGTASGALYAPESYPILAPLPPAEHGDATGLMSLVNFSGQLTGVAVVTSTLQSRIVARLAAAFYPHVAGSRQVLFSSILALQRVDDPVRREVQEVFTRALRVLYLFFATAALVTAIALVFTRPPPKLHAEVAETYDLQERKER